MTVITGGEALVVALKEQGIEVIFGIPGTHLTEVYAALLDQPEIRHIGVRHEQAAAYMADGYARASGRIATALTVAGPGATNTMTAMAEAYADSSPVLLVSSEIESQFIGQHKGLLHEIPGLIEAFEPVTKWRRRVKSFEDIPVTIRDAVAALRTGQPRPAYVQVPVDLLETKGELSVPPRIVVTRAAGSTAGVEAATELLRNASSPLIFAGGGVMLSGAERELEELAGVLQAPVFMTTNGKGSFPDDNPLSMGSATYGRQNGGPALLRKADVVLAVGTCLRAQDTEMWSLQMPEDFIHIDISPAEIGKNYPVKVGLVGDAKAVLQEILFGLGGWRAEISDSVPKHVAAYRAEKRSRMRAEAPLALEAVDQIRANMPKDGILVTDQTMVSYWSMSTFDVYKPRTYMFPMGLATLGFAFPVALGAKVGRPDRKVVAMLGDGGFMVSCQELATAVQNGINIVVLVFNDGGYGAIKATEMKRWNGRYMATDLVAPDFVKFARSFGAEALRVGSVSELGAALAQALANEVVTLVEVPVPLIQPPWLS